MTSQPDDRSRSTLLAEISDLTDALEQCKIELLAAYDHIHDLEREKK